MFSVPSYNHSHVIYTIYKTTSMISLTFSLIAFIPQIIQVHHNKSFHNLSLSFISIILIQDVYNLLQSTLDYQILLALYYCIIDCVLLLQYYYYHHITIASQPPKMIISSSLISTVDASPIPSTAEPVSNIAAGSITNGLLLITSRFPQVIKNYTHKSTKGISRNFILLMVFSNGFYILSLCLDLYLLSPFNDHIQESQQPSFHQELQRQLPLLISTTLATILDLVILYQIQLYQPLIRPMVRRLETRQPSWYTRNQPIYDSQEFYEEQEDIHGLTQICSQQSRGRKLVNSETSSLLIHSYPNYISPPSHYISSSSSNTHQQQHHHLLSQTMFSKLANSLKRYPNSIDSNIMSANAFSPTSFIPSIIGQASSVGKKLNDGSKIPFSPSDFLHDDYMLGNN
ncbi:hypothetical protein JA1_003911 [Spathaspora sp. JA1]|nr:hypothetical protein JA1_003911 [Spathaspora sp. JA1]